ncbi:MAG: rod shape-determining protein MreC [Deltaproteobacteria bacterium]|nr:MAG: rod shape-determining protein MreC [Deltaproteobacteria bacterium]
MLDFFRRYRELLVVAALLVLPLLLYVSESKEPAARGPLDRALVTLASPIQKAIVYTVEGAQDLWQEYLWLVGVQEENLRLRRKVLRLTALEVRAQELEAENVRLRALLGFRARVQSEAVAAPVIGVGTQPALARTLRLGQGEAAGVRPGDAVVTHAGVVGRVVAVGPGWSDAMLLADPSSAIPVLVARSRARATVRGTGDLDRAVLEHALRTDDIQEGDLLVTSGTGGVFPKGIPVGRVTGIERKAYGMFQLAEVIPAVDLARVEEVLILLGSPQGTAPAAVGMSAGFDHAKGSEGREEEAAP